MRDRSYSTNAGTTRSAVPPYVLWLTGVYTGFLFYCSAADIGAPSAWRTPREPYWSFLFIAWAPKITAFDVTANILAYVPIGVLLTWLTPQYWHPARRLCAGAGLGLCFSFLMETMQMWLPTRDPSPVDLCTNFIGALLGSVIAVLRSPPRRPWASALRRYENLFEPGPHAVNCLLALLIWVLLADYPLLPRVDGAQVFRALEPIRANYNTPAQWHLLDLLHTALAVTGLGGLLQSAKRNGKSINRLYVSLALAIIAAQPFIAGRLLTSEFTAGAILGLLLFGAFFRRTSSPRGSGYAGAALLLIAYGLNRWAHPMANTAVLYWTGAARNIQFIGTLQICGDALLAGLGSGTVLHTYSASRWLAQLGAGPIVTALAGVEFFLAGAEHALLAPVLAGLFGLLVAWRPLPSRT